MPLAEVLQTLRETRRRHGVNAAARLAWFALDRHLGRRCFHIYWLSEPRALPEAAAAASSHVFRVLTLEELLADLGRHWTPADAAAMRRGDRCLTQWDGLKLVGYIWFSTAPLAFLAEAIHLNLPADAACIYQNYTAPAYRGQRFQPLRRLRLLELLVPEGKRQLLSYVARQNLDSQHGIERSGARQVGEVRIVRRWGQVRISIKMTDELWLAQQRV